MELLWQTLWNETLRLSDWVQIVGVFAVYMLTHILVLRVVGKTRFLPTALLTFLPFLLFGPGITGRFIVLSLWCIYSFALVCSMNSVSLRMMDEIMANSNQMDAQLLLDRYSDEQSFFDRLALMKANNILAESTDQRIWLLPKGQRIAKLALFMRHLFGIKVSG